MKKLSSVSRDFILISISLFTIVFIVSVWFIKQIYINQLKDMDKVLGSIAKRVERILLDDFEYTSYQMEYISSQITMFHHSKEDIFKILSGFKSNYKTNVATSWNMFSWVDKDDLLTVDGNMGVINHPQNLKNRDYMRCTKNFPGRLCIGETPVYGAVSKQWIIPAGLGIINKKGEYLGSIIFGFDINSMVFKLEQTIDDKNISFALVNNNRIIAESTNNRKFNSDNDLILLLKTQISNNKDKGLISSQSLLNKKTGYIYYDILEKYPSNTILLSYNKNASYQHLWNLCILKIIEFSIFLIGSIITLYMIYRKIVTPIVSIAKKSDQILEGDIDIVFPKTSNYEIAFLEDQLKKIIKYIEFEKTVKSELHKKNIQLEHSYREITILNKVLEQKINEKTFELKTALAAKSEFLNKISIEIRTPVHTIISYTKSLIFGWKNMTEIKHYQYVENIYKNCSKLLILMNNLLDLSKLNSGSMIFSVLENDLIKITIKAINDIRNSYGQFNNEINFICEFDIMLCYCDKDKIIQVLKNIIFNAIKFSESRPINIYLTKSFIDNKNEKLIDAYEYSIEDFGVGIPNGEEEGIFEKFTQSSRTRVYGEGNGLGLAICMDIIKAHRGKIWAKNGEISGSIFSFVIPRSLDN